MIIDIYSGTAEDEKTFQSLTEDHQVNFIKDPLGPESPDSEADIISIFINSKVTKETLDKFPKLKLIATRSTGFDHIDKEAAEERGVSITNVPTYGSRTVAEFVFALLLMLSRKAGEAYQTMRLEGQTDRNIYEGFNLAGKTLGIIGTGNIGKETVKIGKGFAMEVIVHDQKPDETWAKETGVKYVSLEEVLNQSDVISLHLPLTEETKHLINKQNIKKCKRGLYIINTARGGLIETEALLVGLNEGLIAGAGLDVLEGEEELQDEMKLLLSDQTPADEFKKLLANHELLDSNQVIVTPHIAFNTKEAKEEIRQTTLINIKTWLEGKPQNQIHGE